MKQWRQSFSPDRILWLVGLGMALSLVGDTTIYIALPTHTAQAGIALADVGLMLSANRLIRLFINGPYGLLIERIPRRAMLVPSLLLGGLTSLMYTIPGFWPLLIGRLLWGVAWAGIWLGSSTVVLDLATDKNRGRLSGRFQMWFFIGVGLSAILGGVFTDVFGYIDGLRWSAGITLIVAVIWLVALPETRHASAQSQQSLADPAQTASTDKPRLKSRYALATAITLLSVNWLIFIGVIGATMPLLLQDRIGDSVIIFGFLIPLATLTGALSASNQLLSLVASPLSGWLTDFTGNRWALVLLSCMLGAFSLGAIAVGGGALLVVATLFSAVAAGIMQTQVMTLIGDHTEGNRHGRTLGILNTAGDLGSATGPLLAYALLPGIGLDGVFWLMAGILALSIPWVSRLAWQEVQLHRSAAVK